MFNCIAQCGEFCCGSDMRRLRAMGKREIIGLRFRLSIYIAILIYVSVL